MSFMEMIPYLFLSWMIWFPWYLISKGRESSPKRQEKALGEAIERGHVVTACLSKEKFVGNGGQDRSSNLRLRGNTQRTYTYSWKGKSYKYKMYYTQGAASPPREMKLYFVRNPRKAGAAGALEISGTTWVGWLIRYLVIAAVMIVFAKVNHIQL